MKSFEHSVAAGREGFPAVTGKADALSDQEESILAEIIGVRFKKVGKVYYFDPCGNQVRIGDHVIVETARGVEYGEVSIANRTVPEGDVIKPLKKVIRVATAADQKVVESNQHRAEEAFRICEKKIAEHHLDMKLVTVEYTFDLSKVLFYFTADGRVDFRELVKDLASVFRTRIELRQIGVRDEAKMLGGLGICGRPLCCSSFLDDFQPVSINMAKEQNLSLNPTKISGTCGRLMCCLKYENDVYEELGKVTPRPDSLVETPEGPGTVLDSSLLRGTCLVRLDGDPDEVHRFRCAECQIVKAARKGRKPAARTAATMKTAEAKMQAVKNASVVKPEIKEQPEPEMNTDEGVSAPAEDQMLIAEPMPAPNEKSNKRKNRAKRDGEQKQRQFRSQKQAKQPRDGEKQQRSAEGEKKNSTRRRRPFRRKTKTSENTNE